MQLYLDDDIIEKVLVRMLKAAGYDIIIPADAGLSGADDAVHMTHAIRTGRLVLTYNADDFEQLHDLVLASGGHHAGIVVVRKDNDRRDMSPRAIAHALNKLNASGASVPDHFIALNQHR
jgi:predicted nuclease of predicted toxin-antitoxin system